MADNVVASAAVGVGATFATDEIAAESAHYPLTKITLGALDANDGPVASGNPMPVTGTVTANLGATDNAVLDAIAVDTGTIAGDTTSLDGKITACNTGAVVLAASTANIGDVDLELAGTAVSANTGVLDAGTIRVAIATDDPVNNLLTTMDADTGAIKTAVEIIDNAIDGSEMQVDVVAALPAGTNAIGKLAANSGVDIGDVDVTSLPGSIQGPASPTIDSYSHVAINLTTGADQVLVSSAANKQIWVYGYAFSCGDANGQSVSLQDQDDVAVTGIMEFAQYGGISVPPSGNFSMPLFKLGTDKDLEVDILGGDVDGWIAYAIVSV